MMACGGWGAVAMNRSSGGASGVLRMTVEPAASSTCHTPAESAWVQLAGGDDALFAVRAGPQQLQVRLSGALGKVDPDRVLVSGLQGDGAFVHRGSVRGGVVDDDLAVDPHLHGLVRDRQERVRAGELRLHPSGPAGGEVVDRDGRCR